MAALVIVTGGSAGLGRALLAHAPVGAWRVDVSRSGPDDPDIDHIRADLSDPGAWETVGAALAARISEHDGERVTVIHNAGTLAPIGFVGEVDTQAYTANVLLNAAAPQVLGHHVVGALRTHQAGRREYVVITSGAAQTPYAGWSSYGAGKATVDQWVRTVANEQEERGGVRVHAIAPGVVATAMQDYIRGVDERDFPQVGRFRELHATGQLADPDDVARRLWAALDDSRLPPVTDLRDR
jgi:benzil reductase ((S)-benzoin forming)